MCITDSFLNCLIGSKADLNQKHEGVYQFKSAAVLIKQRTEPEQGKAMPLSGNMLLQVCRLCTEPIGGVGEESE